MSMLRRDASNVKQEVEIRVVVRLLIQDMNVALLLEVKACMM